MSTVITINGTTIDIKQGKKQKKATYAVYKRSDLMSNILKNDLDQDRKYKLSIIYDLILDLEKDTKDYIHEILVSE